MEPASPEASPADEPVLERHPCGYPARAWWGSQLVAESTDAVRVEEPHQPPALYFPAADVRFELFRDTGRQVTCPVKGTAQLWTIDQPSVEPVGDGGDVLWRFTEPTPGLEWLADLAALDHDRVRVELVDEAPGDTPADVTIKRFPTWGDASHLVDILDVRQLDDRSFVSVARTSHSRPVVEGSQMLAQAIVAAGRHAPGRRVVSAHMVFMRPADAGQPLHFGLDELSSGRTFTTLAAHVTQDGRRCASGLLLLDATAADVIRHAASSPRAAGPYESEPYDMSVTGRDLRVVDKAYTDDPAAPVGPPVIDAWVRFRHVPDDAPLHAALLAQFTGHMPIAAAMRPHSGIGQRQAHRTLSTAINAIAISFHEEVRADRWIRYHHRSTFAGDGMTHAECRVYDEDGRLLASFTVDAMVREFAADVPVDERTSL